MADEEVTRPPESADLYRSASEKIQNSMGKIGLYELRAEQAGKDSRISLSNIRGRGIRQGKTAMSRAVSQAERLAELVKQGEELENPTEFEKQILDEAKKGLAESSELMRQAEETKAANIETGVETDSAVDQLNNQPFDDSKEAIVAEAKAAKDAGREVDPSQISALLSGDVEYSAQQIRTAQQCWLLYNMLPLSEFGKDQYRASVAGNIGLINRPGFVDTRAGAADDPSRRKISLTSGETSGLGLPGRLNYRNGTKEFTSIQTHEYAQLSPTLRIFKVVNPYANKNNSGDKGIIEFEFNNHTSLDGIARELQMTRPTGDSKGSAFSKGTEVGVVSFEWSNMGTDPFSATRDINATLKLHAQTLGALTTARTGLIRKPGDTEALLGTVPYRYIDLLVQPDCKDEYDPSCFEIKVDVGYASMRDTRAANVREKLKNNIGCHKDVLYLVLTDHSFDVKEDGSIDVTVNFRGRLETIMKTRKMNVLMPYGGSLQKAIPLKIDGVPEVKNVEQANNELKELRKPDASEPDKEKANKIEAALSDLSYQYKQIIHSHILRSLFNKGYVFEYEIPAGQFNLFRNYSAQLSNQSRDFLPDPVTLTELNNTNTGVKQIFSSTAAGDYTPPATTDSDDAAGTTEANDDRLLQLNNLQQRKVKFFYLGDLYGIILDNVTGQNTVTGGIQDIGWFQRLKRGFSGPSAEFDTESAAEAEVQEIFKNFRMVIGNIDFDSVKGQAGKVNLAHIPISVEAYTAFYINTVLASEKANYPFFNFVDDTLSQLVMDPLTTECFGGLFDLGFKARTLNFVTPAAIPEKYYKDDRSIGIGIGPTQVDETYKALYINPDEEPEQIFDFCATAESATNLYNYFVVTSDISDFDSLRGCEDEDRKKGIIHLHFGNATGMMKKISFNKSDIEYLPEMRYAEEGNFTFNQLANVYDVSIDLIGTNLFKPGQHIYVNTAGLGAGDPWDRNNDGTSRSWANLMGLGGYHIVTEVAHSISREGFHTTLKARWVASGKRAYGEGC